MGLRLGLRSGVWSSGLGIRRRGLGAGDTLHGVLTSGVRLRKSPPSAPTPSLCSMVSATPLVRWAGRSSPSWPPMTVSGILGEESGAVSSVAIAGYCMGDQD